MLSDLEILRSLVRLQSAVDHAIHVLQAPHLWPIDKSLSREVEHGYRVGDFYVVDESFLPKKRSPNDDA